MNPLLPELFVFKGFSNRKKIKVRNHLYQRLRTFVVDLKGFEPSTPTMRMWCAPNCATSPCRSRSCKQII